MPDLDKLSYNDLRSLASEMGLDATGKADEIRERIEAAEGGGDEREVVGVLYTTAPEGYDQGYAEREPTEHEHNGHNVRRVTLHAVEGSDPQSLIDYQRDRYHAGLYAVWSEDGFEKLVAGQE